MASLYSIDVRLAQMMHDWEGAENEETRELIADAIIEVEMDRAEKAEAYARIMKNAQADAKALAEEIKRLQMRKKTCENLEQRMRSAMFESMKLNGDERIKTGIGSWSITKKPVSVYDVDMSVLPEEFRVHHPDEPNKKALLEHFKTTGEIPNGVSYRLNEETITFR